MLQAKCPLTALPIDFCFFCVRRNTDFIAIVLQINHRSTDFSMLSCVYDRQNTNATETMCCLLSFSLAFPIFCVCKTKEELWYDAGKMSSYCLFPLILAFSVCIRKQLRFNRVADKIPFYRLLKVNCKCRLHRKRGSIFTCIIYCCCGQNFNISLTTVSVPYR